MRNIFGDKRTREILKVFKQYEFTDGILSLLYRRRKKFRVKEISEEMGRDYDPVYRCTTKLLRLGLLKKTENKVFLSQVGLNFSRTYLKMDLQKLSLEVLSKENVLKVLRSLSKEELSWKELKTEIKVGASSLKLALDTLLSEDLVTESDKYGITDKGEKYLKKFKTLSETKIGPRYELQSKIEVENLPLKKVEDVSGQKKRKVKQEDHYFYSKDSDQYLRYRIETPLKTALQEPRHIMSWSKTMNFEEKKDFKILDRQKEAIEVEYPSILFFLEYFNATEIQKIVKVRRVFRTDDGYEINLDKVQYPDKKKFVEIKKIFSEESKQEEIISSVVDILQELGLSKSNQIQNTYLQIFK